MTPLFERLINIMKLNRNNTNLGDIDFNNVSFYQEDEDEYYVEDEYFDNYKSAWSYAFLLTILYKYNITNLTSEDKNFIIKMALM